MGKKGEGLPHAVGVAYVKVTRTTVDIHALFDVSALYSGFYLVQTQYLRVCLEADIPDSLDHPCTEPWGSPAR